MKTAWSLIDRDVMGRATEVSRGPMPQPGGPGRGPFGGREGRFGPPGGGPPDGPGDRPELSPLEGQNRVAQRLGEVRRPRILDLSGKVIVPQNAPSNWGMDGFSRAAKGQPNLTTIDFEGRRIRVASVPMRSEGQITGVVQVAQESEGVDLASRTLAASLLSLIPLGAVLAGLGSFLLVRVSLRPVDQATAQAIRIADEGALDSRLAVTGADEMSRLAGAINRLLSTIQSLYSGERDARVKLESALEAQKRFTGDASHELRTPLTRVSLAAENGLAASDDPEAMRKSLESVKRSAGQMNRLVSQLLALARADAGQLKIELSPLDIRSLLAEFEGEPLPGSPRLTTEVAQGSLLALAHADSVRRIIDNLLENARRHTPIEGSITLRAFLAEDKQVVIEVTDTGEGIPKEALAKVGERFFRVDSARSRAAGGTGLGLALCRELARAMGGSLTLQSEEGKGVTATLTLRNAESPSSQFPHTEIA